MRIAFLIGFSLSFTGCIQWYCCGYISQGFACSKNGTSKLVVVTGPASGIQNTVADTLNTYSTNGYTCILEYIDTLGTCTRKKDEKEAEAAGETCSSMTETRCSSSADNCGE